VPSEGRKRATGRRYFKVFRRRKSEKKKTLVIQGRFQDSTFGNSY
jgi:hypothetical protein